MRKRPIKQTRLPFWAFSKEADIDYLLARKINFCGGAFHIRAAFFAQQACEKYLKAVMVQATQSYLEEHKLLNLAAECASIDPYFAEEETKQTLQKFDAFDQVGRYGGAANYDPLAKNPPPGVQIGENCEVAGLMFWHGSYIQLLDAFVFRTRGLLDFAKGNFDDCLKSVLNLNSNSYLAGTWRGRPHLRTILTRENRYFAG